MLCAKWTLSHLWFSGNTSHARTSLRSHAAFAYGIRFCLGAATHVLSPHITSRVVGILGVDHNFDELPLGYFMTFEKPVDSRVRNLGITLFHCSTSDTEPDGAYPPRRFISIRNYSSLSGSKTLKACHLSMASKLKHFPNREHETVQVESPTQWAHSETVSAKHWSWAQTHEE